MKNKIININIGDKLKRLNKGGGTPEYLPPEDIHFLDKLINEFQLFYETTRNSNDSVSFVLTHKDNFPAIANRFVYGMKTIFGNNSFEYKTTKLVDNDSKIETLHFIYQANREELSEAIYRLKEIKEYFLSLLEKLNISIKKWFNIMTNAESSNLKKYLEESIKIHFSKKISINYISKTSLLRLLSSGYHKYKELKLLKGQTIKRNENENSIKFVSFISNEYANKSIKLLDKSKIKYQKMDDSTISIYQNQIWKNIDLEGVLYIEDNSLDDNKLDELNQNSIMNFQKENFTLYNVFQQHQIKSAVNVGVIDGGVQNEEFKKYLNYHGIEEFESGLPIPKSSHAEEVCSIILFGDRLSPTLNDECFQPNVHLFDVIFDNIKPDKMLELIEKILEKYHKTIKIWNLSIIVENSINESTMWKNGISFFGNKLDKLQKKYNVLFVVPTGNKSSNSFNIINSPSDSMLAISVGCSNYNKTPTEYSLSGKSSKNKFYAIKPDFSVRTEDNNGYFTVLSNGLKVKKKGTSYAAPWVVRKVAHLVSENIDLFAIPAIFNAFTVFKNKKEKVDDFFGFGILPININEILQFNDDKTILITKLSIKDYSQGFFELKLPKSMNNDFPLNFVMGVNVIPNFSENHSFEYVEDTARVQFGAVSPFLNNKFPKLEQNWKILSIYGDADDAFTKEHSLRQYYGKYKNRYTNALFIPKPKRSYITKKGEKKDIENWGFSIARNDIRAKRKGKIDVFICLIISNIHGHPIYQDFYNLNKQLMNLELITNYNDEDDIKFE